MKFQGYGVGPLASDFHSSAACLGRNIAATDDGTASGHTIAIEISLPAPYARV